jgi:hypothetical protein
MKSLNNFAVLAMVCLAISACGTVTKSSEMKILEAESSLMVYNGVTQGVNKDGQVGVQLTLVGQAKYPVQTTVTKQVPVTAVTDQPSTPQRPVYSRDTRAAKAVPRTPPAAPLVTKTEMKTVVETTTTYRGPEVLASTGGGGPSTGHSVAAGLSYSVPAAAGFVAGNAVAPGTNIAVNAVAKGGKMTQGQGQVSNSLNVNRNSNSTTSGSSSSSSASSAAN